MPQLHFMNEPEDCRWLRETHLAGCADVPEFQSFLLHGNEDCPDKLELYALREPHYRTKPVAAYQLNQNLGYEGDAPVET
jgi:hypothetical protein